MRHWMVWKKFKNMVTDCFNSCFIIALIISILFYIIYHYVSYALDAASAGIALGLFAIIFSMCGLYSTTKQVNEQQIDYWNGKGVDQHEQGNFDAAIRFYDKAISIDTRAVDTDPRHYKIWLNKSNALFDIGDR